MSLEDKISSLTAAVQANTEALTALVAAWNGLKGQANKLAAAGTPLAEVPEVKEKPKAKETPKDEPKPEPKPEAPAAEAKPADAPAKPAATPADLEIIKAKLTQVVSQAALRNREGLVNLLAAKNIKRATELAPEAWPEFIAEVEAL